MTSQTTFTSCMHDQMLESNRDDVKLEAMRCVTVMTAKGKLSVPRSLFPHIVKNVSSKNPELKKMIYLYLTNFADQEPDLALLPIATLQKSLKSPNPLVRSNALKVLTSMRLSILSAILIATIRNSVNDLSPYVRKTVAHSIIKLYRLDSSLREDLLEYIERLFNDKNSMVLSSAVATFNIVCPEKYELVQKHYRRFCFLLADCNEWGQAVLVDLLKRYIVKTHEMVKNGTISELNPTDHDPKILLRSAKPLLHSNNSAVVMSVVDLYITIANHTEVRSTITRPLIRLLYSHREIQIQVLDKIEELTSFEGNADDHDNDEHDDGKEASMDNPSQVQDKATNDDANNQAETSAASAKDCDVNEAASSPDCPPEADTQAKTIEEEEEAVEQKQPLTKDGYIPLDYGDAPKPEPETETPSDHSESKLEPINGASPSKDGLDESDEKAQADKLGDEEAEADVSAEEEEDSEEEDDEEDNDSDSDSDGDDEESESQTESDSSSSGEELDKNGHSSTAIKGDDAFKVNFEFELNPMKDPSAYREVFRPYIKSFFVKHNDCTQIRLAKLRILTNLSSPVNVSQVLRELQAYILSYADDKEFVSASIQSIGRCSILVKEVAHTCLNGLTSLLSNNNEHVVAEAIVVLRSQIIDKKAASKPLQLGEAATPVEAHQSNNNNMAEAEAGAADSASDAAKTKDDDSASNDQAQKQTKTDAEEDVKIVSTVIKQVTKLLPAVTAPQARATILWILAEFCQTNLTAAKCAPEVLRSIAKSFCQEDNFVKLQSLTLASKFLLSLDKDKKPELYQTIQLLTGYLFSLAKYDLNHDVRDRGRFLKKLLEDEQVCAKVLNCAC